MWVKEKVEVFRSWADDFGLIMQGMSQAAQIYRKESLVRSACEGLEEEACSQVRECELGRPSTNLQLATFCGPGDILASCFKVAEEACSRREAVVVPADEVDKKAFMGPGPALIPMSVDCRFRFAVRLAVVS